MLTITVDGELEARLRACASRAGSEPNRFALAALEHSLDEAGQWLPLADAVAKLGGQGELPPLLPDDADQAQLQSVGAFADDPGWDAFQEAIARERQQADLHDAA